MNDEGEIKKYGDTVYIRKTPELSVSGYTIGSTLTYSVPRKDATKLTIDLGKYVAFKIDDVDAARLPVERAIPEVEDDAVAEVHVDGLILVVAGHAGVPAWTVGDQQMVIGCVDAAQRRREPMVVVVQRFGHDGPLHGDVP